MDNLVVIRRNSIDKCHIVNSLKRVGDLIIDINSPEELSIFSVNEKNSPKIKFNQININEISKVLYFGVPALKNKIPVLSGSEMYIWQETEQALLAGLWQMKYGLENNKQLKIINKGYVFSWNRSLFNATNQLRELSKIGWETASVYSHFNFKNEKQTEYRSPIPLGSNTYFLTLISNRYLVTPSPDYTDLPEKLLTALVSITQKYMRKIDLDWCTIPIVINRDNIWAYGFSVELLPNIGMKNLDLILNEVLS